MPTVNLTDGALSAAGENTVRLEFSHGVNVGASDSGDSSGVPAVRVGLSPDFVLTERSRSSLRADVIDGPVDFVAARTLRGKGWSSLRGISISIGMEKGTYKLSLF